MGTILGHAPYVVARAIGFGRALTCGAASGVLGIMRVIERGRPEEHSSNARSHADYVALNLGCATGIRLLYYTNMLLGIGIAQALVGLGFYWRYCY